MGLEVFKMGLNIILEHGDILYKPGDVIRGVVEHISYEPTKVKGKKIE